MKVKPLFTTTLLITALATVTGCTVIHGETSPSQYSKDAAITADIKTKLFQVDDIAANRVHVDTYNGDVLLSGFVRT